MASLKKNTASQNITFCLVNASTGAALTGASITGYVTKDGTQAASGGTFTGLGNGQYNYAPTQAETNCTDFGLFVTATSGIPVNLDFHTDIVDGNGYPSINLVDIAGSAVSATTAQLGVNVVNWNNTVVATPATAGIPDINVKNINNVAAATPGASGGILISGSNSGTTTLGALTITGATTHTGAVAMNAGLTITGAAASGATPATAALTLTGGAASTSSGGIAGRGITVTGGAGAASTNGSAIGMFITAGGTTTVAGAAALSLLGTATGAGLLTTGGATGAGALFQGGATSGDAIDLTATSGTTAIPANITNIKGTASAGAAGYVGIDWANVGNPTSTVSLSNTTVNTVTSVTNAVAITSNRKKGATATYLFTMYNSSTGGEQTGLTVASNISKDHGAFTSTTNSVVEIANGWYYVILTATEMTANNIALQMTATGAVTRDIFIQTQP